MASSGATSKPIVVVGAGGLGQPIAALLADHGEAVVLLATKGSADRLRGAGAIELIGVVEKNVPVAAPPAPQRSVGLTDDPRSIKEAQGLIFTTKGHHLPQVAGALGHVETGWVLGLQNGIVKNEVLAGVFGWEKVLGAATIIASGRLPDGRVALSIPSTTYIGELSGGSSTRVEEIMGKLNEAGLPTLGADDIRSVEWSKACNAVGGFATTVLGRGFMFRSPDAARAFVGLAKEVAEIAAASGVQVGDFRGFSIKSYVSGTIDEGVAAMMEHRSRMPAMQLPPGVPPPMTSMQRDLENGRTMEVEEIFADLAERAQNLGVATPRLELVRDLMRGINSAQQQAAHA